MRKREEKDRSKKDQCSHRN